MTIQTFVAGGAVAVLAGLFLLPAFMAAVRRFARGGLAFTLIAAGFLVSMATKPGPTPPEPPEPTVTNTVEFVLGGHGARIGGGALVQKVEEGASAVAPEVRGLPGWEFVGWDRDFTEVVEDLTVNAEYTNTVYAITYVDELASAHSNPATFTVTNEIVFAAPDPVEGYDFKGWTPRGIALGTASNVTVVASWEETPGPTPPEPPEPPEPTVTNTVEFVLGGHGERIGGGALVQKVEEGASAVAPEVRGLPGWEFVGWDRDFTEVVEDLTVNAEYTNTVYAITYVDELASAHSNPATFTVTNEIVFAAPDPVEGYDFKGWTPRGIALGTASNVTVVASWEETPGPTPPEPPEPTVSNIVAFATNNVVATEGEEFDVAVCGGSATKPTQITVSLQKNTLTSFTAYYGEKKCSFPLVLNWDAGDTEPKYITFTTKKNPNKVMVDQFLTLQLGSEVGFDAVGRDVSTVTVRDADEPTPDTALYVRALAWPANGGKVSGYGVISVNKKTGAVTGAKTLTATVNKWANFAGWYMAKADDSSAIDTNAFITSEKRFKVGKGTDFTNGTYFAYFTDVTAVAAVNVPDATAPGAKGVGYDAEEGAYVGTVGVQFALPVSIEDETGAGSLSISGLPSGLSYNKKTGRIEGVPTKESEKTVTFTAKNAAGKHTTTFDFAIEAIDTRAIGTWNGVVRSSDDLDDGTHAGFGSVQFTAGKTGALSAKVTTRLTGAKSFSAKGYILIDANTYAIAMTNSAKEVFEAVLSYTNDWKVAQLAGKVTGGKFAANDEEVKFAAIRNAFDKNGGNQEALDFLSDYKGDYDDILYVEGEEVGTVTFKVKDGGSVQVKAKSANGTYSSSCAGAFRGTPGGFAAVQAAIRSGKRLWATDAVLNEEGGITGLACDYDAEGEDIHELIGTVPNDGSSEFQGSSAVK